MTLVSALSISQTDVIAVSGLLYGRRDAFPRPFPDCNEFVRDVSPKVEKESRSVSRKAFKVSGQPAWPD